MSIIHKMPLLLLASLLVNILFIGLYYKFALSGEISRGYDQNLLALEQSAMSITADLAEELSDGGDYGLLTDLAAQVARQNHFIIEVKDLSGEVLYHTGSFDGLSIDMSTVTVLQSGDKIYLLKFINPYPLDERPAFQYINDLLLAEFIIIVFTLVLVSIVIHFHSARPIMRLQQDIRQYRYGVKPRRTRRKDEIGQLRNNFVELTDALDSEKQLQQRIIASISHDIKTPLTSVMGYAERLTKENISRERFEKYIRTIYAKSRHIQELVDEFDEYMSFQMEPRIKTQTISAQQLCRHIEDSYQEDLSFADAQLSVSCACEEAELSVDLSKLNRVFGNIISNSVKFAREETLHIEIACARQERFVLFTVSDNGIGIGERDSARIFEPFYTSDESRRVAGLGLSICKSVIESHGGAIRAERNENGGLTISFTLPIIKGGR